MTQALAPHELLLSLGQPSLVLSHEQRRQAAKLCEVLKTFLRQRFEAFLCAHAHEPVACSVGNDTTPLTTRLRWESCYGDVRVVKSGGACGEYLIQRCWAQDLAGNATVMFEEPRCLVNKSAECHFSACRQLLLFPFEGGARTLNITHAVFDRAIYTAEDALLRRQHELALLQCTRALPAGEGDILRLLSWYVSSGCCIHDVHNALKWSISEVLKDQELTGKMWKVLASLRGGFQELATHVAAWVTAHLSFQDWDFEHREFLWTMLGLSAEWVEVMSDLHIRWQGDRLCVAKAHLYNERVVSLVVAALMRVWQFREWTDSRWLTIGPSSRTMVAALLLGLEGLVEWVLKQPGVSSYRLGGFGSMDAAARDAFCLIAGTAFVSDAALALFMDDDRVPRCMEALQRELHDEVRYVTMLPLPVWEVVASLSSKTAQGLRSDCVGAAHKQAAFLSALRADFPGVLLLATDGPTWRLSVPEPLRRKTRPCASGSCYGSAWTRRFYCKASSFSRA